jgi:hypothetical protein
MQDVSKQLQGLSLVLVQQTTEDLLGHFNRRLEERRLSMTATATATATVNDADFDGVDGGDTGGGFDKDVEGMLTDASDAGRVSTLQSNLDTTSTSTSIDGASSSMVAATASVTSLDYHYSSDFEAERRSLSLSENSGEKEEEEEDAPDTTYSTLKERSSVIEAMPYEEMNAENEVEHEAENDVEKKIENDDVENEVENEEDTEEAELIIIPDDSSRKPTRLATEKQQQHQLQHQHQHQRQRQLHYQSPLPPTMSPTKHHASQYSPTRKLSTDEGPPVAKSVEHRDVYNRDEDKDEVVVEEEEKVEAEAELSSLSLSLAATTDEDLTLSTSTSALFAPNDSVALSGRQISAAAAAAAAAAGTRDASQDWGSNTGVLDVDERNIAIAAAAPAVAMIVPKAQLERLKRRASLAGRDSNARRRAGSN